ncbi:MAG TPA: LysM domain-containing protein [Burkholderiales bacterium]|nr:LysM domain-containing protein [Burkholderiales bacterium]
MFKSSTALFLALALGFSGASAQQPDPRQTGNVLEIKVDAPDQYVVQPGDTLWGISGKFLSEPWRWPEIWRLNKDEIRNPHLIYPGNIVRLDRATGTLSIDRLEPRVRVEPLTIEAIPTIPLKAIEPFLARPLVIERGGLDKAPQIVATEEGRYYIGAGARAYVDGVAGTRETLWQVYRPGRPLVDPDTNEALGDEAIYLGTARLVRQGTKSEPATVSILSAVQEMNEGDRLVVAPQPQIFSFVPRAPDKPVRARIMSIYDGRNDARFDYYDTAPTVQGVLIGRPNPELQQQRYGGETGNLAVVSLNKGAKDGLEAGHVLALYRSLTIVRDRSTGPYYMGKVRTPPFPLPEERYGLLMVFRVFENLSYALTLNVQRAVAPGDVAEKP